MKPKIISFPVLALAILTLALSLAVPDGALAQDKAQSPSQDQSLALPDLTDEERANFKAILRPSRLDETDDKIELVLAFWYGCGACRESDPSTTMFANSLPPDVRVVRVPGLFESRMPFKAHGRLFLVLDELGVEESSRQAAFDTALQIHNPNRRGYGLTTKESQETFAASQGVARAAFNSAYDSPAVVGREARVQAFLDNSGLDAVPGMIINGRYVITFFQGPYYQLAEKLINHERARLAKLKPAAEKTEDQAAKAADALGEAAEKTEDQTAKAADALGEVT